MLNGITLTLLLVESALLGGIWSDLISVQKSVSADPLAKQLGRVSGTGGYQPEQLLATTTWTLLSIWLTLAVLQLLPQLHLIFLRVWYAFPRHLLKSSRSSAGTPTTTRSAAMAAKRSQGSKQDEVTTKTSMTGAIVYLLVCWVKVLIVAYLGWFMVMNATRLDAVAGKLSYETGDTDAVFGAEVARRSVTTLYLAFSYALLAVCCLWAQQNIGFIRIGKQMQ